MNAALGSVLARYPASAYPARDPVPLGNAGGLSGASLWRFDSARGPLVARLWPGGIEERSTIERIHGWLSRAVPLRFVSVPIAARDGRTVQQEAGRLWEVAPWKPGSAEIGRPPSPPRVAAAFRALAAFHLAMNEVTPLATSPGLASRLAEIGSLLDRDLAAWRVVVSRSEPGGEAKQLASRWLDLAARLAPRLLPEIRLGALREVAIQPVIRDARPDHFLFEADRMTGLVDFGAMGIDAVSADLARLLGGWLGEEETSRREALAAYSAVRPLSPDESALIEPFERAGDLLGGARWVRWGFVEGVTFRDPYAVRDGLRRSVGRCERLLTPADRTRSRS